MLRDIFGLRLLVILFVGAMLSGFGEAYASVAPDRVDFSSLKPEEIIPGELLVKFAPGVTLSDRAAINSQSGATLKRSFKTIPWEVVKIDASKTLQSTADIFSSDPRVLRVEPNYRVYADDTEPNDPMFGQLWGMKRIKAPKAWDVTTGSTNVVVAVIDTGILWSHEDLATNIWVNPGESGLDDGGNDKRFNGVDDDGNGYVDDWRGWDFVDNDNDPRGGMHGSHVSGTIGGVGNNGKGVAGVNWNVRLVGLKFLGENGGSTEDAIRAVEYCTSMSKYIKLSNNSWGGGGYSEALRDAIAASGAAGQLFVAAAGNDGTDNDKRPHYPSSYDCSNIIAVASITKAGAMSDFSCYGFESVDIAAPGSEILSCDVTSDKAYATISGTSMATPHVTGAAALLWSVQPKATWQDIKEAILNSAVPNDALKGKVATGSELDVAAAIELLGASVALDRLAYRSDASAQITVSDLSVSNDINTVDVLWETIYTTNVIVTVTTNAITGEVTSTTNEIPWWEVGDDTNLILRASGTVTCTRVGIGKSDFTGDLQLISSINMAVHGDVLRVVYGTGDRAAEASAPIDDVAPVITNVHFGVVTEDSAEVLWDTDESSDSYAVMGKTLPLDQSGWVGSGDFGGWASTQTVYGHSVTYSGLDAESRYYAAVRSTDPAGNVATVPLSLSSTNYSDYAKAATRKRVVLYVDDMELGDLRWTTGGIGNVWERGTPTSGPGAAYSGQNCWGTDLAGDYPNVMNAWLASQPVVVRANPRVRFTSWLSLGEGDTAYLEANGGSGWKVVAELESAPGWVERVVNLGQKNGFWNTAIQIRFRVQSDGVDVSSGLYVDDVEISDTPDAAVTARELVLPVDDDPSYGGNNDGDGWPEPGENVRMDFVAFSMLDRSLTGVVATVDCPADGVTIAANNRELSYGVINYADILPSGGGVMVSLTNDASFFVDPIPFFITFSDEQGESWDDVIKVQVLPRYTLSGVVTNMSGAPVAGATVYGSAEGLADVETVTQADGRYHLEGMAAGIVYKVYAAKSGEYSPTEKREVSLPSGNVDFGLGRAFADLAPTNFTVAIGQSDMKDLHLRVSNTNLQADTDLRLTVSQDLSRYGIYVSTPSYLGEVHVAPGATTDLVFTVICYDVPLGKVSGNIYLQCNDVNSGEIVVPVELNVEASPILDVEVSVSDDLLGDGDGFAEPGEWVNLSTFIMNRGSASAMSLTGRVAFVGTSGAIVSDPVVDFGNVLSGKSKTVEDGLIVVDTTATNGMVLPFEMNLQDAAGHRRDVPFNIIVDVRHSIKGVVTDAVSGLPIADVPINIIGAGDHPPAKSGADGHYVISGLKPGSYRVFTGDVKGYGQPPAEDVTIGSGDVTVDFALTPIILSVNPTNYVVTVKQGRETTSSFTVMNNGPDDVAIQVRGVAVEGIVPESQPLPEGMLADFSNLSTNDYFPGSLVVRYRQGADMAATASVLASVGAEQVAELKALPIALLKFKPGSDISSAARILADSSQIQYVEPHYRYKLLDEPRRLIPDDPDFGQLWGLHNVGQDYGTAGNDIDAPEAWSITHGSTNVVIAVCDTGIELNHDDLVGNLWTNPGEIPGDGIDNDGNGYTDDVHGVNFIWKYLNDDGMELPPDIVPPYSNNVPIDDMGHGTHVSGTIGAVGNNSNGVVGVNWNCRIMALKIGGGYGVSAFAAAQAIEYAIDKGVRVSNHSWGGPTPSAAMHDAIQYALNHNHLVICAAGNDGANNDLTPSFPCNDPSENVIAVAATDRDGKLASFSNYGATKVDLAAPGVDILSTVPSNYIGHAESRYALMSGTSMATPHVTGVVGLLLAYAPDASWDMIKTALLQGVVKDAGLAGKMTTGGHLNAYRSLRQLGALWMEFDPDQFVLAPSSSQSVNVTFNAGGLLPSGLYRSDIVLKSGAMDHYRIPVSLTVSPGAVPRVESVRIDDSVGGDGDGYAEPGETIDMYVTLYNSGDLTQPAASGTLASSAGQVTINSSAQSWGTIYSDDVVESTIAASVTIGSVATSSVPFTVDVDDGVNGVWHGLKFEVPVRASYVIKGRVTRSSDGQPVTGATVMYFGAAAGEVQTDSDGLYQISGVPAGSYALRSVASDYGMSGLSRVNLAGADMIENLTLNEGDVTVSPADLQFMVPFGREETKSSVVANSGSGGWKASVVETRRLKAAVISDGARLSGVEALVRSLGISCDGYVDNENAGYTEDYNLLAGYDIVITDLNGITGQGRAVTPYEGYILSQYVSGGGHLIMSGQNPMSADSEYSLGSLLGLGNGGVMSAKVTEGVVQPYSPGNALFDGLFVKAEAGDILSVTGVAYDYAMVDTNAATVMLSSGPGDKITYRVQGDGDVLYWAGNPGCAEWLQKGVLQDLIRNYLVSLEVADVAWLELDFPTDISVAAGNSTNLKVRVVTSAAEISKKSAGVLFVGNAKGTGVSYVTLNADILKSAIITAMSSTGVKRWDGLPLMGNGGENSGLIQIIYAGPDGTNSPAGTDGGTSGDDQLLVTYDTGDSFARVGDGYELAPPNKGTFKRDFSHLLAAGQKIYARAWDGATFQSSVAWGDSDLYTISGQVFETNDFGSWVVNRTIDYPGEVLADLRDQNGDGVPDGWNVMFRGDPRLPAEPLTETIKVEKQFATGLNQPRRIAVWSNLVFVADTGNSRVIVLDRDLGGVVASFGSFGSGDTQFKGPYGLATASALDTAGKLRVVVADTGNYRIMLLDYDPMTESFAYAGKFGSRGDADGEFNAPVAVAVGGIGIFVADTKDQGDASLCNHRVQRFDHNGVWKRSYTGFLRPLGICVDEQGLLYVADSGNNKIKCLTVTGSQKWAFGAPGSGDGQFNLPVDLTIGRKGWIYVSDKNNNRLVVLDASDIPGKPVRFAAAYGGVGSDAGHFRYPWSVAASGVSNTVYVADTDNNRLQLVSLVVDSDGDGMEDLWEDEMGLDPSNPNDGMVDSDGDGLGALAEFRIGTNPNMRDSDGDGLSDGYSTAIGVDPAGPFVPHTGVHISNAERMPKDVLSWVAEPGAVYKIEMARDLNQPEWFVQDVVTGTVAGAVSWTNNVEPEAESYYYRIRKED